MLKQSAKDIYFLMNRVLVLPNTALARFRYRKAPPEGWKIHLGCGASYIPGMINVDGNVMRRKELWLDLRNTLPFADASAGFIYCCHTLEHLFPEQAIALLTEIRRTLSDTGVARLATPSMEHALRIASGEATYDFTRNYKDPLAQSLDYLFCYGQHKYGYSFGLMSDFAHEAGFTQVENYSEAHGVTAKKYNGVTVGNEPEGSLVVELRP